MAGLPTIERGTIFVKLSLQSLDVAKISHKHLQIVIGNVLDSLDSDHSSPRVVVFLANQSIISKTRHINTKQGLLSSFRGKLDAYLA